MTELDRRLRFPREALVEIGVARHLRAQDLDDPKLLEQAMADEIDRPHTALAQAANDLVLRIELLDVDHSGG